MIIDITIRFRHGIKHIHFNKRLDHKKVKKRAITEMTLLLTIQPLYVVTKPERGKKEIKRSRRGGGE